MLGLKQLCVALRLIHVAAESCVGGLTIPNSDRTLTNPCAGDIGALCEYTCKSGYHPIGKHVCQTYETKTTPEGPGKLYINRSFQGGENHQS